MIVLDAGVVIALLNRHDTHHVSAVDILERHTPPYAMHPITLAEVLVGPARVNRERTVMADLLSVGVQPADLGDDEALRLAQLRAAHGLKMPDTCVLATSLHLGVALASFDHRLTKVAASLGVALA